MYEIRLLLHRVSIHQSIEFYNYPRDGSASFIACQSNSLLRSGLLFGQYYFSRVLTANVFGRIPTPQRLCNRVLMLAGTYAGGQVPGQGCCNRNRLNAEMQIRDPSVGATARLLSLGHAHLYSVANSTLLTHDKGQDLKTIIITPANLDTHISTMKII